MRLIDADAFREFLEQIRQDYREEDTLSSGFAACLIETVQDEYLALAPTVDAVEVVHGRWERIHEGVYLKVRCAVCGVDAVTVNTSVYDTSRLLVKWAYCPNCGAKMDGDGNV